MNLATRPKRTHQISRVLGTSAGPNRLGWPSRSEPPPRVGWKRDELTESTVPWRTQKAQVGLGFTKSGETRTIFLAYSHVLEVGTLCHLEFALIGIWQDLNRFQEAYQQHTWCSTDTWCSTADQRFWEETSAMCHWSWPTWFQTVLVQWSWQRLPPTSHSPQPCRCWLDHDIVGSTPLSWSFGCSLSWNKHYFITFHCRWLVHTSGPHQQPP